MNAYTLSTYIRGTRKNDKIDACRLAQVASYDELIRPSYVPATRNECVLRELARYRERQASETTRQKNRVKKVMSMVGLHWDANFHSRVQFQLLLDFLQQGRSLGDFIDEWPGSLGKTVEGELKPWGEVKLEEGSRQLLLLLLRDLEVREELLKLTERQLERKAREFPRIQATSDALVEFPGLGHVMALSMMAEVGNVTRFPSAGHFLVYAGIAPAGGTSGVRVVGSSEEQVVARDRPNSRCNQRLKASLTRVAATILRDCTRTPREDDLYLYARKVLGRDLSPQKRQFKVAAKVGRKFYHVLRSGEGYDGNAEKVPGVTNACEKRSRNARKRQRYRKEYEARVLAERKVETLITLLRERGVDEDFLKRVKELG
jgi:transposase